MHPSVISFVKENLKSEDVKGKKVIEVGSLDVNGSARPTVMALGPAEYWGIDCWLGPSVDVVCNADDLVKTFGEESFDVVLSTEMLEHLEDWRIVVNQLKRTVRLGGLLVLTTRSPGFPYHPYPIDKWRYTKEDFGKIFEDFEILKLVDDHMAPGVFLKARKPAHYREKDLGSISVHEVRP